MKAEKFLKKLGLSVNIVIIILLLVIVYLLHCINDSLSMEYFSIGGQEVQGTVEKPPPPRMTPAPWWERLNCNGENGESEECQEPCNDADPCPDHCYPDRTGYCLSKENYCTPKFRETESVSRWNAQCSPDNNNR